jgi:O-antigen ligase
MKSISSHASIPNPTPLFFLMAGTVVWCLVWLEDPGSPWLMLVLLLAALVLVPASVSVFASRPSFAVIVLMAAAAMPRLFVQVSALKARPEHLACGLLLLALPFWLKKRPEPVKWFAPDYILAAYLGMNLFSSLVMSISPSQTIKWASQQIIVVTSYFLLRVLIINRTSFRRAFNIALVIGAAEAIYAILCFYSNLLFGTEFGMEIGQYGSIPGTYGTQYEANILGSYCGACCAIMLAMYLQKREQRFLLGFAVTFAAMAISLSRGALAGGLVALLVLVVLYRKSFDRRKARKLALAVLGVMITVAPAVVGLWSERFSKVEISDIAADETTRDRVITMGLAYEGIIEHPLLGNGTSSFQLQFSSADFGGSDDTPGWIANTEARILYDTGIVGFALFVGFLVNLGGRVKGLLKKASHPELGALAMALVVYLVSFQFTEGTLLAFPWVHLGLIGAGVAVFQVDSSLKQNHFPGANA